MTEQQQNEINAVKILALAVEGYLASLDELGRNFVGPQARAAVQIFSNIVEERNPAAGASAAVAAPPVETEEAANDAEAEAPATK